MNLHTPERQPHETQKEYRLRQKRSRETGHALAAGFQRSADWPRDKWPSLRDQHRMAVASRHVLTSGDAR